MAYRDILSIPEGATFIKGDLHLHSPADRSFKPGRDLTRPEEKRGFAQEYAAILKERGIQVAALTDHNKLDEEWYNLLREACVEQGVTLFPGTELSLDDGKRGVHLVLVFDLDHGVKSQ